MNDGQILGNKGLAFVHGSIVDGCTTESIPAEHRMASLGTLAGAMVNLMLHNKLDGLASPQVGVNVKMFVCGFSNSEGKIGVIYDPEYRPYKKSRSKKGMERCVSYPLQAWKVSRIKIIMAKYQNVEGQTIEVVMRGKDSIKFQNFTDIINGKTPKALQENEDKKIAIPLSGKQKRVKRMAKNIIRENKNLPKDYKKKLDAL